MFNVTFYLVQSECWEEKAAEVIDSLDADILHNLANVKIIGKLKKRPGRTVYTIDQAEYVLKSANTLKEYSAVTTVSETYAEELLKKEDELSKILSDINFKGITNGIDDQLVNPASGFLLPKAFNVADMRGKEEAKKNLQKHFKSNENAPIFLVLSRICEEKGIDSIIEAIPTIKRLGGKLIVQGTGDSELEEKLKNASDEDVIYIREKPGLAKSIPMIAGADFLLYPSKSEPCGLMPLVACRYGTIPIVTKVGGLNDNFNQKNAIIIDEIAEAIELAFALHKDQEEMRVKRFICMTQDFSWDTRKKGYVEIYEETIN